MPSETYIQKLNNYYSHKLLLIKLLNLKSQKIVSTNAIFLPIVSF